MLTRGQYIPGQGDDEIAAVGPILTHLVVVVVDALHEIGVDMEIRLPDLSGIGKALEVIPCQVTERLCGRGNEPLRTQFV
jgi:hypothetical protein